MLLINSIMTVHVSVNSQLQGSAKTQVIVSIILVDEKEDEEEEKREENG